ncbi:hypothetical protein ERO13_D11G166050v2 [Gossypium hirsutum]|uniref:Uncharacterized protein n=1 Tax=Gossypium darwinii TaxID=34276 RepID=A0A5D2AL54_GOSDA|nr:hypothetical protein ERO13_D11G166050v2 [Gossypium hirsutum]TYG45561.1 hypothetical protein ES288_D11G184600v1 [Gossypium darwinii]
MCRSKSTFSFLQEKLQIYEPGDNKIESRAERAYPSSYPKNQNQKVRKKKPNFLLLCHLSPSAPS